MATLPAIKASRLDPASPLLDELRALLGDRMTTSAAVRERHGSDESFHQPVSPDAVVFAQSTEEVSAIVKACAKYKVPVIPYGTGTSLEGHVAALEGGISLDVSQMTEIVEVHQEDLDCTVQAGVTRKTLNEYLRDTGLFFPVDPGADASLGGMAATRASGTNAVRYGTMRENVLAMTVVLADGRIIKTSRRSRKSAAGYDLTRLFVGSEGTLGVITEVTLRLYGIPEAMSAAMCSFPTIEGAVDAVILTIQSGIPVARVELVDEMSVAAINAFSKTDYPVAYTLFFEFHGSETSVAEQAAQVQEITAEFGAGDFRWETKAEDRNRLWQARHDALYAIMAAYPGTKAMATDVCVPISRLADCIAETRADNDGSAIPAPIVGHVGDGNFHVSYMMRPDDEAAIAEASALHDRLVARALAMGGTCTGEHGIGYGKIDYLNAELGDGVSVMRAIKMGLDPDNIMNPGKIIRI
ncbi:MAG: FAD-linked oxidase C-terminal domain-containing protein [Alphaproteobacteria bacterium]